MKLTKGRLSKIKKMKRQTRCNRKKPRKIGSQKTFRKRKSKHFLYKSLKNRRRLQKGGDKDPEVLTSGRQADTNLEWAARGMHGMHKSLQGAGVGVNKTLTGWHGQTRKGMRLAAENNPKWTAALSQASTIGNMPLDMARQTVVGDPPLSKCAWNKHNVCELKKGGTWKKKKDYWGKDVYINSISGEEVLIKPAKVDDVIAQLSIGTFINKGAMKRSQKTKGLYHPFDYRKFDAVYQGATTPSGVQTTGGPWSSAPYTTKDQRSESMEGSGLVKLTNALVLDIKTQELEPIKMLEINSKIATIESWLAGQEEGSEVSEEYINRVKKLNKLMVKQDKKKHILTVQNNVYKPREPPVMIVMGDTKNETWTWVISPTSSKQNLLWSIIKYKDVGGKSSQYAVVTNYDSRALEGVADQGIYHVYNIESRGFKQGGLPISSDPGAAMKQGQASSELTIEQAKKLWKQQTGKEWTPEETVALQKYKRRNENPSIKQEKQSIIEEVLDAFPRCATLKGPNRLDQIPLPPIPFDKETPAAWDSALGSLKDAVLLFDHLSPGLHRGGGIQRGGNGGSAQGTLDLSASLSAGLEKALSATLSAGNPEQKEELEATSAAATKEAESTTSTDKQQAAADLDAAADLKKEAKKTTGLSIAAKIKSVEVTAPDYVWNFNVTEPHYFENPSLNKRDFIDGSEVAYSVDNYVNNNSCELKDTGAIDQVSHSNTTYIKFVGVTPMNFLGVPGEIKKCNAMKYDLFRKRYVEDAGSQWKVALGKAIAKCRKKGAGEAEAAAAAAGLGSAVAGSEAGGGTVEGTDPKSTAGPTSAASPKSAASADAQDCSADDDSKIRIYAGTGADRVKLTVPPGASLRQGGEVTIEAAVSDLQKYMKTHKPSDMGGGSRTKKRRKKRQHKTKKGGKHHKKRGKNRINNKKN